MNEPIGISLLNTAPDLQYGTVTESILLGQYDALNGLRSNKKSFTLQSNLKPIFQKQFNPADTSTLDTGTVEVIERIGSFR